MSGAGVAARLLSLLLTLGLLAGCGSATRRTARLARRPRSAGLARGSATASSHRHVRRDRRPPPASCATTVASTLGTVAARVYHEAATGGDVAQAVHRVQSSTALAGRSTAATPPAPRAALQALLARPDRPRRDLRGGHVFAQAGSGAAIAPVHGSIPGTSATLRPLDPARPRLPAGRPPGHRRPGPAARRRRDRARRHDRRLPPRERPPPRDRSRSPAQSYQSFTLPGAVYPSGPAADRPARARPPTISCPGSAAQARVETLGHVGERIYQEELHSPDVAATLRHMESSTVFQRAVAAGDVAGDPRGDHRLLRRSTSTSCACASRSAQSC